MNHRLDRPIYLIFFVSGACGLVYQVLWGKYLSLFIGNTTHAHMIVLATFMGGLSAGSFLFGRIADRVSRPLKLYAWLEIGIGLYGALYSPLMEGVRTFYFASASALPVGGTTNIGFKLLLAFFTVILPTFLMGGTLPVMCRYFVRGIGSVGKRIALLYFINSFGAVVGTLLGGFYVVEHLGLIIGLTVTGIVNVVAGLIVLTLDRFIVRAPVPVGEVEREEAVVSYEPPYVRLAVIGVTVSGFTSMIYELAWFRVFAVVLESSTYSFSLMLAAFITGITVGSLVAGQLMGKTKRVLLLFGLAELGIAISVLVMMPIYERLPYTFWVIRYLLNPTASAFAYYNLAKFALCFAIMLPPTLFFGMTLPFVSQIASVMVGSVAEKVGSVYAANTIGTLFGALFAGLVFIPFLGVERSLELAFCLNALIACIVLWQAPDLPSPLWRRVPLAALILLIGSYALFGSSWNPARFAVGVFRNREAPPESFDAYTRGSLRRDELVFYREDLSSNVAVLRQKIANDGVRLSLAVNGKVDATSDNDAPTQILLAQLPMTLKNQVDDALLIGLGSGMTAGSILTHPIARLDCVEISTGVAEGARLFGPYNHNVLDNPKLHLIVEDAKTYINTTKQKYDVVISEPSNPWMAGIGNLYSIEFFRDVERTLKPGGLVVQWFHSYEISDAVVATAVRTFHEIFPYVYLFQGNKTDIILVGARQRLKPDFDRMAQKIAVPAVQDELARINVSGVSGLLSFQMISPENLPKITAIGSINSDYRPIIEYAAPLAFFTNAFSNRINDSDERYTKGESLLLSQYLETNPLAAEQIKHLAAPFQNKATEKEVLATALMAQYLKLRPEDRDARRAYVELSLRRKNHVEALALFREIMAESDSQDLQRYAGMNFDAQRNYHTVFTPQPFDSTFVYLYKALALAPDDEVVLSKLGRAALVVGRYDEALQCFLLALATRKDMKGTPQGSPRLDDLLTQVGLALYYLGQYDRGKEHLVAALNENEANTTALQYLLMLEQAQRFREREQQ